MQLVYSINKAPVLIGDVVHVRNQAYYIENIVEPHKPSSTGRVWCRSMDEHKYFCEWFPNVVGAEWIGRTDQGGYETRIDENGQSYIVYK